MLLSNRPLPDSRVGRAEAVCSRFSYIDANASSPTLSMRMPAAAAAGIRPILWLGRVDLDRSSASGRPGSGLAVTKLGVLDAGILGRAAQAVALLDGNLVVRVALVGFRLPARLGLFRRGIVARVGRDRLDLGVCPGPDF